MSPSWASCIICWRIQIPQKSHGAFLPGAQTVIDYFNIFRHQSGSDGQILKNHHISHFAGKVSSCEEVSQMRACWHFTHFISCCQYQPSLPHYGSHWVHLTPCTPLIGAVSHVQRLNRIVYFLTAFLQKITESQYLLIFMLKECSSTKLKDYLPAKYNR